MGGSPHALAYHWPAIWSAMITSMIDGGIRMPSVPLAETTPAAREGEYFCSIIEGSDSTVRIEKRDAGADCNPYLLMAADIAAGLDGIEGKTEPTAITTGNAYEDDNAPTIPLDLADAISLARNSGWLRDVLGADQHEIWLQQAERELAFFNQQVTPFETARYLGTF